MRQSRGPSQRKNKLVLSALLAAHDSLALLDETADQRQPLSMGDGGGSGLQCRWEIDCHPAIIGNARRHFNALKLFDTMK